MKRSEIVQEIYNYLQEEETEFITKEQVDVILNLIEKAGMLPPKTINPAFKTASSFAIQYDNIPYQINEWEPEE